MWKIKITNKALNDFNKLDKGIKKQVLKGMYKVSQNPLPTPNGYGKPLDNKGGNNLTGFYIIKYKNIGIRVVYSLVYDQEIMNIIVVSEHNDDYC